MWRETQWLLKLVAATLWPLWPLRECLARWPAIQRDLAERRRKRLPRINVVLC